LTGALVLNFINTVTYFVLEGRESDRPVLGWGAHHAEAEPLRHQIEQSGTSGIDGALVPLHIALS
jgi:hypothetical protein